MGAESQPPQKRGSRRAWDEGRAAREGGKGQDECPYSRDQGPQFRAWNEGWGSLNGAPVEHRVPPVTNNTPTSSARVVPEGHAIRLEYRRSVVPACPACRRILLDSGSQAVLVQSIHNEIAYMRCRAEGCEHQFKAMVVK